MRLVISLVGTLLVYLAAMKLEQHGSRPIIWFRRMPQKLALGLLFVVGLGAAVLTEQWVTGIALPSLGWLVYLVFLKATASRRRQKMEGQLPDALGLIGNAMSAGFSLLQALRMVAREVPQPLGGVFQKAVSIVNLGVDLTEAMRQVAGEVKSEDFDTVVMAVSVQRRTGGNLPRILEVVAGNIREKQRLAGKIKSLTAQGRLTAVVVALLPVALLAIMSKMMPTYVAPLFQHRMGQVLLALAAVLEVVGLWMVQRISKLNF